MSKKPNLGISDNSQKRVVHILNTLLSDEFVLYVKTLNCHWNVEGPDFSELHEFFGKQYEELAGFLDEVAERARALGGKASGSLKEFIKSTRIKDETKDDLNSTQMIAKLLSDHESIIQSLRNDLEACTSKYGDAGTSDFLTGLMEKHEKMAWMLRSYLQK